MNKEFLRLSRAAGLWRRLLCDRMLRRNLPVPGLRGVSLDDLHGPELEHLSRRAVELQRNWRSPNPVAKKTSTLRTQNPGRVIFLEFLKRPECLWLVSVSLFAESPRRRRYTLECWDVVDTPKCIARMESHHFLSIALNQSYSPAHISGDIAVQGPL